MRRSVRLAAKATARAVAAGEQPPEATPQTPATRQQHASVQQTPISRHHPRSSGATAPLPPPEVLMIILKSIDDRIDRWKTAAALALAGAFGAAPRAFLEPFWLEEAQAEAPPGATVLYGPFTTTAALKEAANASSIVPDVCSDVSKAQLEALVPQSVPVAIVRAVRADLRRRRVPAELAAAGLGEFANHYLVWKHIARGTPTLPRLLDCLRRERELVAALTGRGLPLDDYSYTVQDFIERGEGDVASVLEDVQEKRFLLKYTEFGELMESMLDTLTSEEYDAELDAVVVDACSEGSVEDEALGVALEELDQTVEEMGREWLLHLPDVPQVICRRYANRY